MKNFFMLCIGLVAALTIQAQSDFPLQFADKDGNIIADGTTIKVTNAETNEFGEIFVSLGLFVKNTKETASSLRVHYSIQTLESGFFQICFPVNCITKSTTGTFETSSDLMNANETRNLNTEWIPATYGKCVATYQIEVMNQTNSFSPQFEFTAMGPKITVEYVYADPASIHQTENEQGTVDSYYSINGTQLPNAQKGFNIVKLTNGKKVKSINR